MPPRNWADYLAQSTTHALVAALATEALLQIWRVRAPADRLALRMTGLLQPLLTGRLKAGARIVTNFVAGSMKDWKPDRVDRFLDPRGKPRAILYLWTVPGRAPRPGTE